MDAVTDHPWQAEPIDDLDRPRYPTQRRWIERSAHLLGLDPALPSRVVEEIRDHLGVDGLDHHLACQRFRQAKSLKARGAAILDVQQQAVLASSHVQRLLAAGWLGELWGHPYLWDAARGRRLSLLSRTSRALRGPP